MKIILTLICVVVLLSGCTERMTKQFVVPQAGHDVELRQAGNWFVEAPQLIAFKQRAVDDIPVDSRTFWLTIRSFETKNNRSYNSLSIDSIGLQFLNFDFDSTVWRVPSRVVPFIKSGKNYLAFDFFNDQGIEIPPYVKSLRLTFDAIITDDKTKAQTKHPMSFKMFREETIDLKPFMIE